MFLYEFSQASNLQLRRARFLRTVAMQQASRETLDQLYLAGERTKASSNAEQKQKWLGCHLVAENSPANAVRQTCGSCWQGS